MVSRIRTKTLRRRANYNAKPAKPPKVKQGEAGYVSANTLNATCLQWLAADRGCDPFWRNNTGATTYAGQDRKDGTKGKDRFVHFGYKGSADVLAVNPLGWFVSVETKTPRDTASPEQTLWAERVNANGGIALFVSSVEDLQQKYDAALEQRMAEFQTRLNRYSLYLMKQVKDTL